MSRSPQPIERAYPPDLGDDTHPTLMKEDPMKLQLLALDTEPIIGPTHPDSHENRFGYEGGTAHKVGGRYYIFTTEVLDEPKQSAVRIACWSSADGLAFSRDSVIVESNGDWTDDRTYRMATWSPMAVFDSATDRWHLFYVGYRLKPGSEQPYNMSGRMVHLQSTVAGQEGIGGPFEELGWVNLVGEPDPWEGPAEVCSFFPFRVADGWRAFYGSNTAPEFIDPQSLPQHNNTVPETKFWVGLAAADSILGPWTRQTASNPVLMDPEFIENPIVRHVDEGGYVTVYDGGNTTAISYATSSDGVNWNAEQLLELGEVPAWLNATRTPLGLISEGDGVYTMYFTAYDGVNPEGIEPLWHDGFGYIGRLRVKVLRE